MLAENCLKKKISKYGLCLFKDTICITDGASVTTKFGTLIDAKQQLCSVHIIHLAIKDILYKSKVN
jgi:hypothetical protein